MLRKNRAMVCWLLMAAMAVSPSLIYAQQPGETAETPTTTVKPDVAYVTPDAAFGAVAYPRRVLTAPEMVMLPVEVFSAAGKQELGLDPLDVEQVLVVAEPPGPGSPPGLGVVVRFSRPYQLDGLLPEVASETVEGQLDGRPYRQAKAPMMPSIFMPDAQTLIVATDGMLQKMVANRAEPQEGTISKALGRADASQDVTAFLWVVPLRPLINAQLAMAPVPPPLAGFKRVPDLLTGIELKARMTGRQEVTLNVFAQDEAAAIQIEALIDQALQMGRRMMLAQMTEELSGDDPVEKAMLQYTQRMSEQMLKMIRPVREGHRLQLSNRGVGNTQVATIGILVALLLPAIQAARAAARRAALINNLKQIGLGMQAHANALRRFPARANFDAQGKPLLSWRVHMLPYIEENALYDQFKLDEPWDSPHNKQLIPKMPTVYRSPFSTAPPEMTVYLAPVGPGTIFEGQTGLTLGEITDGTANTILVVEANDDRAVIWTKPDDWTYDPQRLLAGLGQSHPSGFLAIFADGSVHFLSRQLGHYVFRALLSKSGGEQVGDF